MSSSRHSRSRGSILAKLRALSPSERRTLLQAAAALGRARIEIRFRSFQRIASSLEPPATGVDAVPAPVDPEPVDPEVLVAVSWAFRVLGGRIPWWSNCLTQAVAAKRLLTRRGIPSTLHLGVAEGGQERSFEAHAWLEAGGRVITGQTERSFEVLYSHP